ncbi:MAG: hypothetical protein JWM39_646 [Parcubacteria group bacterium]|nr:hypothetical protein [Parcubacteria group bacterium]
MNKETRIEKIAAIVARDKEHPHGRIDIPWQDRLVAMPVYLIPLDCLIYNKYNGRILSRTKSLENQSHEINPETDEGKAELEKLLLESNPGRNKQTLESIRRIGQEKVGIITRDGIVIDGNRRSMLLRQVGKSLFKTVVLDVTLEENPLEIERLETTYQMGEDEKLGYNPVEKYLKAKGLKLRGISESDIASWMGESEPKVKEYLEVMATMDDYLDYLGYNGIYTQLDGREDLFISLTKWMRNFSGEKVIKGSAKGFDGYKNSDVDDLKQIAFDYIRARFEGKEFRIIAEGQKMNHIFGDKSIWVSFRDTHFEKIQPVKDTEGAVNLDSENLSRTLDDRDRKFLERTEDADGRSFLEENIDIHRRQLENRKYSSKPLKLVADAADALAAIDQKNKTSSSAEVLTRIEEINQKTFEMLGTKSPERLLARIVAMLKSLSIDNGIAEKDKTLERIKEIESIAYQLEKDLKRS